MKKSQDLKNIHRFLILWIVFSIAAISIWWISYDPSNTSQITWYMELLGAFVMTCLIFPLIKKKQVATIDNDKNLKINTKLRYDISMWGLVVGIISGLLIDHYVGSTCSNNDYGCGSLLQTIFITGPLMMIGWVVGSAIQSILNKIR